MTSALQRRIEDETEAARQQAWADRKEHGRGKRNPKWVVDHLLDVGQISAEQHDAAQRYASAIDRSQPGGGGGIERVDAGPSDPHARMWDAAVCVSTVRDARCFVACAPSRLRTRIEVLDRLFAFNGREAIGARPTLKAMRNGRSYDLVVDQVACVLDLLDAFWTDRDRAMGR